jgi:hypothetical protein
MPQETDVTRHRAVILMALELYAERMRAVAEQDPTNGQCFAACAEMAEEAHRALDFEAADALIRRNY